MKKLTRFQKQIAAVVVIALLAAALFAVYMLNKPSDEEGAEKPAEEKVVLNYGFNEAEEAALKAFKGTAVISFAAEKGKGDDKIAPIMSLADDYAAMNSGISLAFGKGDADFSVKVGTADAVEMNSEDVEYYYNEDEKLYAFSGVRHLLNTMLFGDACGVAETDKQALKGFDTMGNVLNAGGNIIMFSMGDKYGELLFVEISNKQSESITFYVDPETTLPAIIGAEAMNVDQISSVMLMSFAQNPVATGVVENPEPLAVYGLDSDESAQATVLVAKDKESFRSIRIGKALPDGSGYYALCDGKDNKYRDTVYMIDGTAAYALRSAEQFMTANYGVELKAMEDVFTAVNDMTVCIDGETVKLEHLTKEDKADLPLNYSWKVTAPDRVIHSDKGFALSGYYNVGDLFNALGSLSSKEIVVASPTEEDLAEHGLDNPYRSYSWMYDDSVYCSVYMSKPDDDGKMYVYGTKKYFPEEGDPYEYTLGIGVISKDGFANEDGVSYITYGVLDFVDDNLFTDYITAVDSITVVRNGETHVFRLNKNEKGDIVSATLDNNKADLQSVRRFYVSCIHPTIIGDYKGEAPEKEDVCIIMNRGGEETRVAFTRLNSVEVFATVNGTGTYLVNYNDLSAIIEDYEILLAGGIVPR